MENLTPELLRRVTEVMDRAKAEGKNSIEQLQASQEEVPEAFGEPAKVTSINRGPKGTLLKRKEQVAYDDGKLQ